MTLHVVTGDTFGTAKAVLAGLPVRLMILEPFGQSETKAQYIDNLSAPSCVAIGNGRNERPMIEAAGLRPIAHYANPAGDPLTHDSMRMVIIAEKP